MIEVKPWCLICLYNEIIIISKKNNGIINSGINYHLHLKQKKLPMKNSILLTLAGLLMLITFCFPSKLLTQNYTDITQGVDTLAISGAPGPIFPYESDVVPIISGDLLVSDTGFSIFSVAKEFGEGRVIAIGHESLLADNTIQNYQNQQFLINSMNWLNSGNKQILIKNGWLNDGNLNTLKSVLMDEGYSISSTNDLISSDDLVDIDIVLFGNDWNNNLPYPVSMVNTITNFVDSGGGIFIAGLGWSFSDLAQYPMNKIAKVFGFEFVDGIMWGTDFFTEFYPDIQNLTIPGSINSLHAITDEHALDLPTVLQIAHYVRDEFTKANIYLRWAIEHLCPASDFRDLIYNTYYELLNSYPLLFKKGHSYDNIYETAMIWNRERMQYNFRSAKETSENNILEIANSLGLTNKYLEIWQDNKVLLLDNSKLDTLQLKFTRDILSMIPQELHNLGAITFRDYLGQTNTIDLGSNNFGTVNTFTTPVGEYPENQFPDDVSPGVTAIFCAAMAHEINHVVDDYYINSSDVFKTRRNQLINQAGTVGLNYLRNMNNTGYFDFFVNNPQEFFASIANQWFTDSEKVLELGLTRFDNSYKEPINQFLFFADIYSLQSDSTIFYTNDIDGNISSKNVYITRNNNGFINSITLDGEHYSFELDPNGNVISYNVELNINSVKLPVFNIFPNPANKHLYVEFTSNENAAVAISLKNIYGHTVKTKTHTDPLLNILKLDIDGLHSGVYIIIADYNGLLLKKKVIVN